MLSTRVVPTAGQACVGGVDVVAEPALAKQAIGVVAQSNTLDRSLTVWENLYFHCRYFGIDKAARALASRRAPRAVPSGRPGQGRRLRAVGRHGPAAHGRARHRPPAAHPLPRRAHRRPRPAEPARAVGDPPRPARRGPDRAAHHPLHGGGRPALRPRGDHGPRPHPRPRHAARAQGLGRRRHDRARRRRPATWPRSPPRSPPVSATAPGPRPATARSRSSSRAATAWCRGSSAHAESGGFAITDLSVHEPTLETVFITLTGKELRE